MIVFVVSFLLCDDCFLRCWDSRNPLRCQVGRGFCLSLVGRGDAQVRRWLPRDPRVGQGLSVFSGWFPGFGHGVFESPGVFGSFSGGWFGSVSGWFLPEMFGLVVNPPAPVCFFVGPFWPCFWGALFVSCVLHLSGALR